MSGHAILSSCHNCEKDKVHLNVVYVSQDSSSCGEFTEKNQYHHIHVNVACDDCKRNVWKQS